MNILSHLREPVRLLLTWQASENNAEARTRRAVAELVPSNDLKSANFKYLRGTSDYESATKLGFRGFPAFRDDVTDATENILQAFLMRLPPRKREDFGDFLKLHGLPSPFPLSDFALLGYTGAKLPSDGFALTPIFETDDLPCEIVAELAGTRHMHGLDITKINVGDVVDVRSEPLNEHDPNAIAVYKGSEKLGYINRLMTANVNNWLQRGAVSAEVLRKNGSADRPLIFITIHASGVSRPQN